MKFSSWIIIPSFLAAVGLLMGFSWDKVGKGDITPSLSSGKKIDSTEFMLNLTDGSKAYLGALGEFLRPSGESSYADELQDFSAGTPRPWDAAMFKAASAKAKAAPVSSETSIKAPKDIASAHITGSFVLAGYAGYLFKEALQDSEAIVRNPMKMPVDTTKAAGEAAKVLPSFIKNAALIVTKSSQYMSKKGIAKPSVEEATLIIQNHVGFVRTEVVDRFLKSG